MPTLNSTEITKKDDMTYEVELIEEYEFSNDKKMNITVIKTDDGWKIIPFSFYDIK